MVHNGNRNYVSMDYHSKIEFIKGEILTISPQIQKGNKETLQIRLDLCLGLLGMLTQSHPNNIQELDFLKDHIWSLIERLSRRII
jgi:hypothetical protein